MVTKQQPFISTTNVRSVLQALVHPLHESETNPLAGLLLVDNFLITPDFPATNKAREFALYRTINNIISDEYRRIRVTHDVKIVDVDVSRDEALKLISIDAQQDSIELIAWSWLYYRYVCIHLGISTSDFCRVAGVDERTLRRYQRQGVDRLTDCLINMEWKARTDQRKRRLTSNLPTSVTPVLIGRDKELATILSILRENQPAHILITGMSGIGKTSLVVCALRSQIEIDALDQIVWLNDAQTLQSVQNTLIERLLPKESSISLKEYAAIYKVAVVLDNVCELILDELTALDDFLMSLGQMQIIMISDTLPDKEPLSAHHIIVGELKQNDALHLAEIAATKSFSVGNNPEIIYEQVGGNPLMIQLAVRNHHLISSGSASEKMHGIFSSIANQLDAPTMKCWCALSLIPSEPFSLDYLHQIWPQITLSSLDLLAKHFVLDVRHARQGFYQLLDGARKYIKLSYRISLETQTTIGDLLLNLKAIDPNLINTALPVAESILLSNWITLNPAERDEFMANWLSCGIQARHWAIWAELLENEVSGRNDVSVDYFIAYGVCLRSIARRAEAHDALMLAISLAGKNGLFEKQASAILEIAILFRHEGSYEQATKLLARATRIATRRRNHDLIAALASEAMQIALDMNNLDDCEKLINQLPDNAQSLLLQSEYFLRRGNWMQCHICIGNFLNTTEFSEPLRARGLSILGQLHKVRGDLKAAYNDLSFAVILLEQAHDSIALARTKTNLSAICIEIGYFEDAQSLLLHAENLQSLIYDPVGLAATKHNLYLLAERLNR